MKRFVLLLLTTLAFALPMPAFSRPPDIPSGFELLQDCESGPSSFQFLGCAAYLNGVYEGVAVEEVRLKTDLLCTGQNGPNGQQLILVFIKWAHDNPQLLNKSRALAADWALHWAFPCR